MHRGYHWIEGRFPAPVFDPISLGVSAATLATVGTGASVVGGAVSALGAIAGGISSSNAYSYKAQVAKNNSLIAKRNADYALESGEIEQRNQGLKDRFRMGELLTGQAAKGLDVNSGSALDVRTSQAAINRENQMMIKSNASRKAYGYEVESQNALNEAKMDKAAGTQAEITGGINAGSSIVSTVGSVSDKWLKYSQAGVGTSSNG